MYLKGLTMKNNCIPYEMKYYNRRKPVVDLEFQAESNLARLHAKMEILKQEISSAETALIEIKKRKK
jgi:hypothetical protein